MFKGHSVRALLVRWDTASVMYRKRTPLFASVGQWFGRGIVIDRDDISDLSGT